MPQEDVSGKKFSGLKMGGWAGIHSTEVSWVAGEETDGKMYFRDRSAKPFPTGQVTI